MKEKRKLLYAAGVLLAIGVVAMLLVNTASSKPPGIRPVPQWVYSAKFVCGQAIDTATLPAPVVPANYRTAINVHNPQSEIAAFTKKVVLALPEPDSGSPSPKIQFKLEPDWAFEIDCTDIYRIGDIQSGTFAKGFVVITTPEPLDVIGVYTSTSAVAGAQGGITLDVEEVTPKLIKNADP